MEIVKYMLFVRYWYIYFDIVVNVYIFKFVILIVWLFDSFLNWM